MSNSLLRDMSFALILASMFHAAQVEAAELGCSHWTLTGWFGQVCGCCPDDYCAKPLPAVQCKPAQRCPDNYCKKPLPAMPCKICDHSCDCYDIKPLPVMPRCCEPWYKCIPYCGSK